MRKPLFWILIFYASHVGSAWSGAELEIPEKQQFLFEITHEGGGFHVALSGLYVDRQGHVYEYNASKSLRDPSKESRLYFYGLDCYGAYTVAEDNHDPVPPCEGFTEDDLLKKFTNRQTLKTTIAPPEVLKMYALIEGARQGKLSHPQDRCLDAGLMTYVAYIYESKSDRYKPVLLYQAGERARQNQSESARILSEWLFTLSGGKPSCGP
jgi:hypothetical protein